MKWNLKSRRWRFACGRLLQGGGTELNGDVPCFSFLQPNRNITWADILGSAQAKPFLSRAQQKQELWGNLLRIFCRKLQFPQHNDLTWDQARLHAPRHLLLKTLISSYCWGRSFISQVLDMFYHGENHPRDMNTIRQNRSIPEYKRLSSAVWRQWNWCPTETLALQPRSIAYYSCMAHFTQEPIQKTLYSIDSIVSRSLAVADSEIHFPP